MRRLHNSRFFRCFVCLLVICCILVNCSPIRAEATAVGATVVAGTTAAGITGLLFAMAMGVVFVDLTAELITATGESMTAHLQEYYADDEETTNTATDWLSGLEYSFGGSGGDGTGNGDGDNKIQEVPAALYGGLIDWAKQLINGGSIEIEEQVPLSGNLLSYNGYLYAPLPEEILACPAQFIFNYGTGVVVYGCQGITKVSRYFSSHASNRYTNVNISFTGPAYSSYWSSSSEAWGSVSEITSTSVSNQSLYWSNVDITGYGGLETFKGTEPVSYEIETTTVTPDIYVGDIPSHVQDGTFDDDDLKLPYINYGDYLNSSDYISDLNNIASQLADGTVTYEQYYNTINNYQTETEPDVDTETTAPTDPPDETQGDDGSDNSGGNNLVTPPSLDSGYVPHTLSLRDFFPFCIPFDLYDFFAVMAAEPEAPQFHWELKDPLGNTYPIDIDLTSWDSVAAFFRRLQLLLFITGLAAATRKFIKW